MPLAFRSESHGTVAFGFFNIESDMLLLDRYFFFATDFCETICKMVKELDESTYKFSFPAYVVKNPANIGDLHGGIAGTHYSGFIGESYKRYPFPRETIKFKQQTEGFKTRDEFENIIMSFGEPVNLRLTIASRKEVVAIGPYVFTRENFSRLIDYVIGGGYPGWLDDVAPDYVLKMQKVVAL
jgi:hypothetical protein